MSTSLDVSIKRDIGRLIAHGLPSKLTFDHVCMRMGSFDEGYIQNTINDIVVSNLSTSDFWIRKNYAHSVLQDDYAAKKNLGRPRELDFFITPATGRTGKSLAIEVKWTPSTHCTWRKIMTDLYRLKLVAMANPNTTDCMFVLCGPKNEIAALVEQLRMQSKKRAIGNHHPAPLALKSLGSKSGTSSLRPVDENGRLLGGHPVRKKLPLRSNGKHRLPSGIICQLLGESTVGVKEWTAAVWRVM